MSPSGIRSLCSKEGVIVVGAISPSEMVASFLSGALGIDICSAFLFDLRFFFLPLLMIDAKASTSSTLEEVGSLFVVANVPSSCDDAVSIMM